MVKSFLGSMRYKGKMKFLSRQVYNPKLNMGVEEGPKQLRKTYKWLDVQERNKSTGAA